MRIPPALGTNVAGKLRFRIWGKTPRQVIVVNVGLPVERMTAEP
jgi:hypothetical protein